MADDLALRIRSAGRVTGLHAIDMPYPLAAATTARRSAGRSSTAESPWRISLPR
jgi:hypothetical protein